MVGRLQWPRPYENAAISIAAFSCPWFCGELSTYHQCCG